MRDRYNFYLSDRDREVLDRALCELRRRCAGETGPAWMQLDADAERMLEQLEAARFRLSGTRR